MYPSGYLPFQGAQPQFFAYTYYMPGSMVLPSIQTHNFSNQPLAQWAGDQARYQSTAAQEFPQFYTLGSYYPFLHTVWPFEYMSTVPYQFSYGSSGFYTHSTPGLLKPSQESWPEGSFFWGELRWGRLTRVWSAVRELPDFVRDDLLRVYGTYPYTEVYITYHGGEFLVEGKPRVGQQEYRMERRVVRGAPSPHNNVSEAETSRGDDEAEGSRRNQN